MPQPPDAPFLLSDHAAVAVRELNIDLVWITRALAAPAGLEPDRDDSRLKHALIAVPEFGDRVLRVV